MEPLEDRTVPNAAIHSGAGLHDVGAGHRLTGTELRSMPMPSLPNIGHSSVAALNGYGFQGGYGYGLGGHGTPGGGHHRPRHGRRKPPRKRSTLSLKYTPVLGQDFRFKEGVAKGRDLHGITPNLATDHEHTWFVHGNSDIQIEGKGSQQQTIQRFERTWTGSLNADGSAGALSTGQSPVFGPDGTTRFDVPGVLNPPPFNGTPDQWTPSRQLEEFVVGIKGHPEAGFLYFTVVIDTMPGQYQVYMSEAQHLTQQEWEQLKSTTQPRQDGTTGGGILTTGPQMVPAG
jgi:hypothetical protein